MNCAGPLEGSLLKTLLVAELHPAVGPVVLFSKSIKLQLRIHELLSAEENDVKLEHVSL